MKNLKRLSIAFSLGIFFSFVFGADIPAPKCPGPTTPSSGRTISPSVSGIAAPRSSTRTLFSEPSTVSSFMKKMERARSSTVSGTNRIDLVNLQLCTVNNIPSPKKAFIAVSLRQKAPVTIFGGTMAGGGDVSVWSEGSALNIYSMEVRGRSALAFQNGSGKMEVVNSYIENADQLCENAQNASGLNFVATLADRRLFEAGDPRWTSFLATAGGERRTWTPVAEVKSLNGIVVSPEDKADGPSRRLELTGNWNGGEKIHA